MTDSENAVSAALTETKISILTHGHLDLVSSLVFMPEQ